MILRQPKYILVMVTEKKRISHCWKIYLIVSFGNFQPLLGSLSKTGSTSSWFLVQNRGPNLCLEIHSTKCPNALKTKDWGTSLNFISFSFFLWDLDNLNSCLHTHIRINTCTHTHTPISPQKEHRIEINLNGFRVHRFELGSVRSLL